MGAPLLRWVTHGSPDYLALVELRRETLRRPLGLDFTAQQLTEEKDHLHLGAWEGNMLIGCAALILEDAAARMRQVAVVPESRGKGIGRILVVESEAEALRRGAALMTLHARHTALAFYERLGYSAQGEPFMEVGIPHRNMTKALRRFA